MSIFGQPKECLDTPALWVNLKTMEENIKSLAHYFASAGVHWRPHIKGIKVPALAHKLLDAGAIGITCAKLSEAEIMAAAGIKDILIANQVVGSQKVNRLASLRRHADVMVAVDSLENAREISAIASAWSVTVRVLVELDTGMHRAGILPGEAAVPFVREVSALPGLKLTGVMSWEGHAFGARGPEERRRLIRDSVTLLVETAECCRRAGLGISTVSCGGSVSYQTTTHMEGVTESQTGGAVFTDVAYQERGVPLTPSLFVAAMVTSRPTLTRVIVDAGRKSMDGQVALPVPVSLKGASVLSLSAEHGVLQLSEPSDEPRVGDRIDFTVGYGDNTVYQHDVLYGIREGLVEVAWPITARGKLT